MGKTKKEKKAQKRYEKKHDETRDDMKIVKKYKGFDLYFEHPLRPGVTVINKKKKSLTLADQLNLNDTNLFTRDFPEYEDYKEIKKKKDKVKKDKHQKNINKANDIFSDILHMDEKDTKLYKKGKVYIDNDSEPDISKFSKTEKKMYKFFVSNNPYKKKIKKKNIEELKKISKEENKLGIMDSYGRDEYLDIIRMIDDVPDVPKEVTLTRDDFGKGKKGKKAFNKHMQKMKKKYGKFNLNKKKSSQKSISEIYKDSLNTSYHFDNNLEKVMNDNSKYYIDESNTKVDIERIKASKDFNKHIEKKINKWSNDISETLPIGSKKYTKLLNAKVDKEAKKFLDKENDNYANDIKKHEKAIKSKKKFYESILDDDNGKHIEALSGPNSSEMMVRDKLSSILL